MDTNLAATERRLGELTGLIGTTNQGIAGIAGPLGSIDNRLVETNQHLGRVEVKLESMPPGARQYRREVPSRVRRLARGHLLRSSDDHHTASFLAAFGLDRRAATAGA